MDLVTLTANSSQLASIVTSEDGLMAFIVVFLVCLVLFRRIK